MPRAKQPIRDERRASASSAEAFVAELGRDPEFSGRIVHVRAEEARPAGVVPLLPDLPTSVREALESAGRSSLFHHQREAIEHAVAGRNVAIATETSSGKSLCFQVPVLSALTSDVTARALFIFPTNPLANDQEASLRNITSHLPEDLRPRIARLQGGMGAAKEQVARQDPQIVLTNPEMVHLHLLPAHARWAQLWKGLRYLVVDEVHLYRGAFGGHVANLLRRVRRCAWRYGARPTVIASSATVGNPRELAQELCAAPFELVDRSSAPRGRRTTVLWRPPEDDAGDMQSYIDESVLLFRRALAAGLQTILFARSRQTVELIVTRLEEATRRSRVQLGVRAYRSGYLREEREAIEQGLRTGSVRGVVSTNALEVGIDIGSLDVCIIAGYPGSTMALRQQAGRVGRRDRTSAIFLVASQNPIDTFLMGHPEMLLDSAAEKAVVGRLNPFILKAHVASAAAEFPLWEKELDRLGGDTARQAAAELVERGDARWETEGERRVLVARGRPQAAVSLRSASQERWTLIGPEGDTVGELDAASLAREAYPGAIYLHQGSTFRVKSLENGQVLLAPGPRGLSTRVRGDRQVTIDDVIRSRPLLAGVAELVLARVTVVDRYSSYLESYSGRRGTSCNIEPPIESSLQTEGLIFRLVDGGLATLRQRPANPAAALHGAEHALGALCVSFVLCDRDDVESDVILRGDHASVVLFDRYPGGLGIASTAFDSADAMLDRAGGVVETCTCESGCPACVHINRCLRGNDEIDKQEAIDVLRVLRGLALAEPVHREGMPYVEPPRPARPPVPPPRPGRDKPRSPRREKAIADSAKFRVGDRVEHGAFGTGDVIEIRPSGRVVVDFGDGKRHRITPTWLRKTARGGA